MKTTRHELALSLLLASALSACSGDTTQTGASGTPVVPAVATFQSDHAQWVQARSDDLGRPDGWTSLIGLHWVETGRQSVGSAGANDIRLAIGPDTLGQVELRGGVLYFRAAADAGISVDGKPLQGEIELKPEGRGSGTQLVYDGGKGRISAVERAERLALRVRHADAPSRLAFKGLDFFAPDEAWSVQARFVAHPPGKTLPIVNIIGNVSDSPNPGYVEFDKDGRTWRLEAVGDPTLGLSLMFQDQTSGKETYAVGRYLHTDAVAADGSVRVDFNRAYNPPCAYTEHATCPLPPPENRFAQKHENGDVVRLAVLAGERKYAGLH